MGPAWADAPIEVTIPRRRSASHAGTAAHRRDLRPDEVTELKAIPVTTAVVTLIDLAVRLPVDALEAAINDADRLDVIDPRGLRRAVKTARRTPGIGRLRSALDRRTFTLTGSELERRFLPIARRAGLPAPLTQSGSTGSGSTSSGRSWV